MLTACTLYTLVHTQKKSVVLAQTRAFGSLCNGATTNRTNTIRTQVMQFIYIVRVSDCSLHKCVLHLYMYMYVM
jgi:hypothetical protein